MEDFNTYEFATEQKIEGKYLAFRIALLILYVAFAGTYFTVAYHTKIIPIVAILPIFFILTITYGRPRPVQPSVSRILPSFLT